MDGHDLTLITAGLSAITLITGFVVLAATRRALPFDRRLVLSGYRPGPLITAKTTAALAVAAAVGAYAAVILLAFWRPAGLWAIAVAFILAAATYATFGLLIGVLVRGDLEGFFLIIMIAMLDTFLENPVDNPLANKAILEFFPSYGPTQFAAAGAFHHQMRPAWWPCRWPGPPPSPCSASPCCACACHIRLAGPASGARAGRRPADRNAGPSCALPRMSSVPGGWAGPPWRCSSAWRAQQTHAV